MKTVSALAKTALSIGIETVQKSGFSPGRGYNAERRYSGRLKPCAIGLGLALLEQVSIAWTATVLA